MTRTTLAKRLFGPVEEGGTLPALEEARGGTLVLEDIEALPQALQARLLTWINEQGTPARDPDRGDLATCRSRARPARTCCARTCISGWRR